MSKRAYFLILVFFIIGVLFLAERILALKQAPDPYATDRFIRLKELKSSFYGFLIPSEYNMRDADSLIKKKRLFRTDENGFIMPSRIYNEPDSTVVFLGGSTTECKHVEEKNRFPYLAGRFIEKETGLKINSYNSGVSAGDSLHSIDLLLNKIIPMEPDIVVLMHNINDLTILLLEGTYWHENPARCLIVKLDLKPSVRGILKEIKDVFFPNLYSALYVALHPKTEPDQFSHVRGKRIDIDEDYLVNEFQANLQVFVDICKARNILPVLMTQHNRIKYNPDSAIKESLKKLKREHDISYEAYKNIYGLFNEAIRETGFKNDILVIDLDKAVPKEKEYMWDAVHLNDIGSRLVAEIISRDLKPLIIKK